MSTRPEWTFELSGGRLCLDFVNTLAGMRGARTNEHLAAYADLLAFARQAGALDERRERRLLAEARRRPDDAARALAEAIALREAMYRVFVARARGEAPPPPDLERISAALGAALARRRLVASGDGFALGWTEEDRLDAPLWPVLDSAAALLTSGEDLARVRVCGLYDDQECSWLFVDASRAGTRRWCSMKDCGNRAKARRHYQRHRDEPDA